MKLERLEDILLNNAAKRHMVEWNIDGFKEDYPSLYDAIIEAIHNALHIQNSNTFTKDDLQTAFTQARCNKRDFNEWFDFNYPIIHIKPVAKITDLQYNELLAQFKHK